MKFTADLHVHSKFSMATAKNLDLENLYVAAQRKGITVVGTGDFTHPAWFAEIQEKLVPAEPGLFRLRDDIAKKWDMMVPQSCRQTVRFILQCEISNIYKKDGKTRKNHHILFIPDTETVGRFNARLDAIGNIKSDGRPILGLDTRNLLEILLETSDESFLVPAHIWTPWFSVFGSKSGFDSLEECFEDLLPEIFAAETGLSSDPPMNWRISDLDRVTLISNSDAHSPFTLGRNANRFDTELSYPAIKSALKTGDPNQCLGTLDMYPQEGKYHFDGHRKCKVCQRPADTMATNNICPVCGKPLTIGVLYRVEELADRPEGDKPENALPFYHIIPLPEILSEILDVGPKTKKVDMHYQAALESLGPEMHILLDCPVDEIPKSGVPLLDEAVRRMRAGQIHISPGYDGEDGKIKVFDPHEKEKLLGQQSLFKTPGSRSVKKRKKTAKVKKKPEKASVSPPALREKPLPYQKKQPGLLADLPGDLNDEQRRAVHHKGGPLLIIAGPGAGKTLTLTHRIAHIIRERNVSPENILAVTFTNKAAKEMRDRLKSLMGDSQPMPMVATFHASCFQILKDEGNDGYSVIDEDERNAFVSEAVRQVEQKGIPVHLKPGLLSDLIISAKQLILEPGDDLEAIADPSDSKTLPLLSAVYETYQNLLTRELRYDYEDLILKVVKLFESDHKVREKYQKRLRHILVDEYQDLNQGQYRIVKALAPPESELCVIGDPDQSIYGFRGSDVRYFQQFEEDYPKSEVIRLTQNYRSAEAILEASHQVIRDHSIHPSGTRVYSNIRGIKTLTILELATEKAEAVAVGKTIENLIGGMGFHSVDFDKIDDSGGSTDRSFSDFAVLYRTNAQSRVISDIFARAGIPYQIANREHAYTRKGIAELISFLKITEESGILNDFQRIANMTGSGISRKMCDRFRDWVYQNDFTLKEALSNAKQSFVPSMTGESRRKFCLFADRISEFRRNLAGKSVEEKLMFLFRNAGVSSLIKENSETTGAYDNLIRMSKAFKDRTSDFFEMIALHIHDADTCDFNTEKVTLMTIHAAKGLEFPVVFITGCEADYIPFKRSEDAQADIDEERRLFYVAMTRARDRLFLTHAKKRTIYGKTVQREISPFAADIEKRLIRLEKSQFKKRKKETQVQLDLFINPNRPV
ncbi:UvrD-helicase domain-containing protein [Desulfobacterales bacterium HSG2]|nr:UvrD-helicase domain-containing protein [Desulfobacterales bacterium HSG2]